MKHQKAARLWGAILVAVGSVLILGMLLAMLGGGENAPETRAQLLVRAQQNDKNAQTALNLVQGRIAELEKYYAADGENAAYQERLALLAALKEELASAQDVSEGTFQQWRKRQSVDGVETEVVALNYLQSQLATLHQNRQQAQSSRAAAETAPEEATEAVSSRALYYAGLAIGAVLWVLGLRLNHGYQMKHVLSQILLYTLLVIGAIIMVFPFYWMISSSLKTRIEVSQFPPQFIPNNPFNFDNYRVAFKQAPFATYFLNSVVVCFCSVAVVTFTTILAAFAFSRLKFPGREVVFSALLSMMMLPFEMLVITNYSTIIHLNLNDSLSALVLPFISSIFYTYIMRNFFASIPESLYWSARVDGCSNWRYLWKVMVPIGRPSLVTVILLNALASWNSFMWPLLVIKSTPKRTLPFGLYAFTTEAGAAQELIMAASTVVVLPMIVLFLFARKQILRGVARGGLKG
mgnify:FL=1